MSIVELRSRSALALVDTRGARLLKWQVNGVAGLYSDPAKPKRITHPCGPNFGPLSYKEPLVKDNVYSESGYLFHLPQHGFLREAEWQVKEARENMVLLELVNTDFNSELSHQYPHNFLFTSFINLRNNALQYRLSFANLGEGIAKVDLASHTYHPFEPGLEIPELKGLSYNDQTDWERQKTRILDNPIFASAEPRDWHFNLGQGRIFSLKYPSGRQITLQGDESIKQVVIWTSPQEGNFFCFEPVLCGRNALNNGQAIKVNTGQSVTLDFVLTLT